VNIIACRAFAVFWWLLHAYAVIVMAIAMFEKTMLLDAPLAGYGALAGSSRTQ
jgi:hypothetical protein